MANDLDEIESAARAATSGRWFYDVGDESILSLQDEGSHTVTVVCVRGEGENVFLDIDREDAHHIAMANPDAVLKICAKVRQLRAALKEALELLQINGRRDAGDKARVDALWKLVGE